MGRVLGASGFLCIGDEVVYVFRGGISGIIGRSGL